MRKSTLGDVALQSTFATWHLLPAVMNPPTIWLLNDGKPGHENQSVGLADAIARRTECVIFHISVAGKRGLLTRIKASLTRSAGFTKPDFIIGAGHATHFALLWLARKHRARSIVLMRPSLPMGFFDLCIVPAHDFANGCERENVMITQGAVNRVAPPSNDLRRGKMILIGGPSGTHGWDGETLLAALTEIATNKNWQLTDSRRTPNGFMDEISSRIPEIEIFPHQETTPEWLPTQLANAGEVWVTEDSVSMIYEALSSGASVGLLPMPRTHPDSRVLRGLERLIGDGFLTTFSDWEKRQQLKKPPAILREADRCAEEVLRKFRF